MIFILINIFLLISIFLLVLLISMVWPPDSPWAPFWTTKPDTARAMCRLAKVNKKTIVYDLGCGTGNTICIAAKEFGAKAVGIEIDPLRFLNALWNVHVRFRTADSVKLIRENFFNIPFNKADIFFMYLIPNALKRLTPKFLKEVKPGTLFVSYVYPLPEELFKGKLKLLKHDLPHRVYVYKMVK